MPTAFITPLSRTLAGSLCLSEGMLTPVDLALWLAAMADELVRVGDPDASGVTLRDAWRTTEDDAAPIYSQLFNSARVFPFRSSNVAMVRILAS